MHIRPCDLRPGEPGIAILDCGDRLFRRRVDCDVRHSSADLLNMPSRLITEDAEATAPSVTSGSGAGIAWLAYPLLGICFGVTLTQSEVISWYRFQEMFRFQSPRMYEINGS